MAEQLTYSDEAADGYDRTFGCHASVRFVPSLVRAAQLRPGMRVLDIATGTGLVAEGTLSVVGPNGHVTAADVSPAMLGKAHERLGRHGNCSIVVGDGQSLSFPDGSFDVVLCNLGLMFFPDPARGLSEFRRVLRPGGAQWSPSAPQPNTTHRSYERSPVTRRSSGRPPTGCSHSTMRRGSARYSRVLASRTWRRRPSFSGSCGRPLLHISNLTSGVGARLDRLTSRCPRKHAALSARRFAAG